MSNKQSQLELAIVDWLLDESECHYGLLLLRERLREPPQLFEAAMTSLHENGLVYVEGDDVWLTCPVIHFGELGQDDAD